MASGLLPAESSPAPPAPAPPPPEKSADTLEIEKLRLEVQMLRQELRDGRTKLFLSVIATSVVLIGLVVDRYKSHDQQRAQAEQREREVKLAVYQQTSEAYLALSDAASKIAASRNYEQVEAASNDFMKLYYGRAHIISVGNPDVGRAKVAFRQALRTYLREKPTTLPNEYFGDLALQITYACQPYMDPRKLK